MHIAVIIIYNGLDIVNCFWDSNGLFFAVLVFVHIPCDPNCPRIRPREPRLLSSRMARQNGPSGPFVNSTLSFPVNLDTTCTSFSKAFAGERRANFSAISKPFRQWLPEDSTKVERTKSSSSQRDKARLLSFVRVSRSWRD